MSKRVLWIIGSPVLVIVVLVTVGLTVGLSDYDIVKTTAVASNAATSTSTSSTTTTIATAATVAPATVAAQTPATVGYDCTTPESAAQSVVNAWKAGDQATARRCGSDAVVDQLFQSSGSGAQWTFQGCGGPDPGVPRCQFSYNGGTATMTMNGTEASGWKAVELA